MTVLLLAVAVVAIVAISLAAFYALRQVRSSTRDRVGLANAIVATLLAFGSLVVSAITLYDNDGGGDQVQNQSGNGEVVVKKNSGTGVCVNVNNCHNSHPSAAKLAEMPLH